jgi:hypothetical protein
MSFKRRILAEHKIFENNEREDSLMLGHALLSIIEIHNEHELNCISWKFEFGTLKPWKPCNCQRGDPLVLGTYLIEIIAIHQEN